MLIVVAKQIQRICRLRWMYCFAGESPSPDTVPPRVAGVHGGRAVF